MLRGLLNGFYIFSIATMAVLYLFGIQSGSHFSYKPTAQKLAFAKLDSVHSSDPVHQPFEIEDKEEQPETEDSEGGITSPVFDSADIGLFPEMAESFDGPVIPKSQAEYHTPGYVRLRSILI